MDTVGGHVRSVSGSTPETSTRKKFWTGLSLATMEQFADKWDETRKAYKATRQQAYFSAEFLMGLSLIHI
mgnify:FL=1